MSDSIDRETAVQVARLARIHLPVEAVDDCQQRLSLVLGYIGKLNELELPPDVEPFFGAVDSENAIRSDVVGDSYPRDLILKNAPDTDGEFYCVPPVFK